MWDKLDTLDGECFPEWVEPDLKDLADELVKTLEGHTYRSILDSQTLDRFGIRMKPLQSSRELKLLYNSFTTQLGNTSTVLSPLSRRTTHPTSTATTQSRLVIQDS